MVQGGGEQGRTNERPGTDHVISGPMGGVEKTAPDGANTQTHRHLDMTESTQGADPVKHRENCKTLPFEHRIGCQCVKLFYLKMSLLLPSLLSLLLLSQLLPSLLLLSLLLLSLLILSLLLPSLLLQSLLLQSLLLKSLFYHH